MDGLLSQVPNMKPFSDQACANRYLKARVTGYSYGTFFRQNAKHHIGLLCLLALLVAVDIEWPNEVDSRLVWFGVGLIAGALVRNIALFQGIRLGWPFTVKVTDWAKVQRAADGLPID